MVPRSLASIAQNVELDQADAFVASSLFHGIRALLFLGLDSYTPATVDDLLEDTGPILGNDCGSTFLAQHPDFFLAENSSGFATAEEQFEAALDDLIAAIDSVRAEVDLQSNDLLIEDDLTNGTARAKELLVAIRDSLDAPTFLLDTCGGTIGRVHLERLFDAPLDRSDMPEFEHDVFDNSCHIVGFPDPTFNALLPDLHTSDAVVAIADEP